jgi:hypothetical protein
MTCCMLLGSHHAPWLGLQADVRYINRDAAALLLSRSAATSDGGGGLAFIDVRRHDERTLYGSIPRAQHVPGAPGPDGHHRAWQGCLPL